MRRAAEPGGRSPSAGAVAACFDHPANGSGEPHLHSHLLLCNLGCDRVGGVVGPDLSWWTGRHALGAVYQLGLRHHLRAGGLDAGLAAARGRAWPTWPGCPAPRSGRPAAAAGRPLIDRAAFQTAGGGGRTFAIRSGATIQSRAARARPDRGRTGRGRPASGRPRPTPSWPPPGSRPALPGPPQTGNEGRNWNEPSPCGWPTRARRSDTRTCWSPWPPAPPEDWPAGRPRLGGAVLPGRHLPRRDRAHGVAALDHRRWPGRPIDAWSSGPNVAVDAVATVARRRAGRLGATAARPAPHRSRSSAPRPDGPTCWRRPPSSSWRRRRGGHRGCGWRWRHPASRRKSDGETLTGIATLPPGVGPRRPHRRSRRPPQHRRAARPAGRPETRRSGRPAWRAAPAPG